MRRALFFLFVLPFSSFAQGSGSNVVFDGNNDYINLGTGVAAGTRFTQECWIYHTITDNNFHGFLGTEPGSGGAKNRAPGIWIYQQDKIHAGFGDGTNWNSWVSNAGAVPANTWNHVAITFDGTNYKLYVNGDSVYNSTVGSGKTPLAANILNIGRIDNYFQGNIDEVRVWNVVRTRTQLRDNMCKKLTGSEANLVGYWRLDNGAGASATATVVGTTGTLTNGPTWTTSSAPIGDASTHLYTNSWAGQTISLSSSNRGDFQVNTVSGTPKGVHLYRVDAVPNTTSGLTGLGGNNKYFGTFIAGGTAPTYTSVYDYSTFAAALADEANLVMNTRAHNAATPWTNSLATLNTGANTMTKTGISARGEFILSNPVTPLPIELINFSANQNEDKVDLYWTTATEINNDYFTIEKTKDFVNYESVSTIDGADNSTTIINYQTKDNTPYRGISYYRLKQTDFNGDYTYSPLVAVDFKSNTEFSFDLYPNPSSGDNVNLLLNGSKDQEVLVVVYDINGKESYSKVVITSDDGGNVYAIDPSNKLSPGVYLVTATSNQSIFSKRMIVK